MLMQKREAIKPAMQMQMQHIIYSHKDPSNHNSGSLDQSGPRSRSVLSPRVECVSFGAAWLPATTALSAGEIFEGGPFFSEVLTPRSSLSHIRSSTLFPLSFADRRSARCRKRQVIWLAKTPTSQQNLHMQSVSYGQETVV